MNSSPPTPQNPNVTASTQAGYNQEAAKETQAASNVNQVTPFGSLNYAQTGTGPGGIPLYTATTQLSPQMQAIVNSLQGGVTNQLDKGGYATNDAGAAIGNMTEGGTKDMLDKEVSYLNPFFTQQQEQLDTQLRNQGIGPESPAYTRAMNNLSQSQNQSVTGFLATAAPAAQQMSMNQYLAGLGVSQQLMGLINPGAVTGSLINPPQANVAAPNYTAAVSDYNNANMAAYNAKLAQQNAMISGAFGVPTAILGGWAGSPAGGKALTSAFGMA